MKRTVIVVSFIVVVLLSTIIFMSANSSRKPLNIIESKYNGIMQQLEENDVATEKDKRKTALEFSELFSDISIGSIKEQSEYADLFRKITNNAYDFDDSEVFVISAQLSKLYDQMARGEEDFGIQDIKVVSDGLGGSSFVISYIDAIGYSARVMKEDDEEYQGDYLTEYDGTLGKYRVEISIYDTNPSDQFLEKYPVGKICELESAVQESIGNLKMKCVYTPDHAFVIYIGSNKPIYIEETDYTKIRLPMGDIKIDIKDK